MPENGPFQLFWEAWASVRISWSNLAFRNTNWQLTAGMHWLSGSQLVFPPHGLQHGPHGATQLPPQGPQHGPSQQKLFGRQHESKGNPMQFIPRGKRRHAQTSGQHLLSSKISNSQRSSVPSQRSHPNRVPADQSDSASITSPGTDTDTWTGDRGLLRSKAGPENFALFVIKDNGEQRKLKEDDYPLVTRIILGPHEDIAKLFLMDGQQTPEISSSEVAQFLNLSIPECRAILERTTRRSSGSCSE
ncbi:ras association domain protein [Culex quinquefasciatus]|uniref:Ras association domain protein n=1 Tax=Culex quinquefasciatus TaxID=7176 RepID=B0WSV0_CULQU|nr:ras association domain protein [Culex quinquefasciatus]|eukprot:XP_001870719.1 ras association domain protein [Culex quinquefasciatus]